MSTDIGAIGEQIERLTHAASGPQVIVVNSSGMPTVLESGSVVARPDLAVIPDILLRPQIRKEQNNLKSVSSFIAYYMREMMVGSVIFCDADKNAFGAIFDYETLDGMVLNHSHRAKIVLEPTLAFSTWKAKNGKAMSQDEFALFIEENVGDIVEPEAAVMIQVSTEIRAVKDVQFESKVKLENGANVFSYKEEINGAYANGSIEVPKSFFIGIPIYRGMNEGVKLECKLRYRIDKSGGLTMWYSIPLLERAIEQAYETVKNQIVVGVASEIRPQSIFDAVITF